MYHNLLKDAVFALHYGSKESVAVELLKALTPDQRAEVLGTAHMLADAVERAQRESGDL